VIRAAALTAFDQQFHLFERQPPPQQVALPHSRARPSPARNRAAPQRPADEIATLETKLLAVVRANPGGTMAELAPMVGAKSADLRVPVVRLRAKKQIKLVGQRQFARYFPVGGGNVGATYVDATS